MRKGRPTKLTPELQQKLCKLISEGNYVETAAASVGITSRTLRQWRAKGEQEKEGLFAEFASALKGAEARAEIAAVKTIKKSDDWKAAAWLLERKYPDRWGRFRLTKMQLDQEREALLLLLKEKLPAESYAQVIAALAGLVEPSDPSLFL